MTDKPVQDPNLADADDALFPQQFAQNKNRFDFFVLN
jgi:hypothetical protein